ncbi:MAG: hypothetical protein ABIR71_03500 [Chthoniobacterales bacterium]
MHVVSADEMRVYWYKEQIPGSYAVYKRRPGGWYHDGDVIVTS